MYAPKISKMVKENIFTYFTYLCPILFIRNGKANIHIKIPIKKPGATSTEN